MNNPWKDHETAYLRALILAGELNVSEMAERLHRGTETVLAHWPKDLPRRSRRGGRILRDNIQLSQKDLAPGCAVPDTDPLLERLREHHRMPI